jgi:hypothetical protein
MKLNMWEAISQAANAAPAALAVITDVIAAKERQNDNLRTDNARLKGDVSRVERNAADRVADARREARHAMIRSLGDGWHLLSTGGDFLVKNGCVEKARCADPEKRDATSVIMRDAFGVWLSDWNDDGEAMHDEIPF